MERQLAAGVILEKDGKILMHERNFEPGKGKLDLIGGLVEENETIEEAAVREAKEESGLIVKLREKLGSFDYFDRTEKTAHIFIAEIAGGKQCKSAEGLPVWVNPKEIKPEDLAFPQFQVSVLKEFLNKQK